MGNYKNLKFRNTTPEFKRWTKEFPPLDPDAVKDQSFRRLTIDTDTYYCELQLVQGFITDNKFISQNFRKYDRESENFESVYLEESKDLAQRYEFINQYNKFAAKHLKEEN